MTGPDPKARMPRQIPFIIANEGAERFSFYGMRNILTQFLTTMLLVYLPTKELREHNAKDVFHTFVIGVYFFPLLGGWLSDRYFGKYRTILWFSMIYCVGQLTLAIFPYDENAFYIGLALIALGSGGIKPLVSTFVGDQFDSTNKHLAKVVFDGFYWIINLGSFFASALMPWFLRDYGPHVAFGVAGALMAVATLVFWLGRQRYVHVPPAPPNPHSFLRVTRTALTAPGPRLGSAIAVLGLLGALTAIALFPDWGAIKPTEVVTAFCLALVILLVLGGVGTSLQLERARGVHPDDAVDGVRAVFRILILFAFVTPFWSLFDQKASTWVLQANAMSKPSWFESSQMQLLNPALVMLLIPFNNLVLFPALRRRGWEPTPLRRMTTGIALAGVAWIIVGIMQVVLDAGTTYSITWQILPYAFLTLGEVLVSATGLEFAYSQAPPSMKGVIMAFWSLVVTIGNLWVILANASIKNPAAIKWVESSTGISSTAFLMFFFAAFALIAALCFGLVARRYRMADHYRSTEKAAPLPEARVNEPK